MLLEFDFEISSLEIGPLCETFRPGEGGVGGGGGEDHLKFFGQGYIFSKLWNLRKSVSQHNGEICKACFSWICLFDES